MHTNVQKMAQPIKWHHCTCAMPKMTKIQLVGLHAGGGPETRLPIGVA